MRVLSPATASKTTSPPLAPSPPSGPPNSTNFSRRKLTAPGPPAPERTKILAWSRKCIAGDLGERGAKGNRPRHQTRVKGCGKEATHAGKSSLKQDYKIFTAFTPPC